MNVEIKFTILLHSQRVHVDKNMIGASHTLWSITREYEKLHRNVWPCFADMYDSDLVLKTSIGIILGKTPTPPPLLSKPRLRNYCRFRSARRGVCSPQSHQVSAWSAFVLRRGGMVLDAGSNLYLFCEFATVWCIRYSQLYTIYDTVLTDRWTQISVSARQETDVHVFSDTEFSPTEVGLTSTENGCLSFFIAEKRMSLVSCSAWCRTTS